MSKRANKGLCLCLLGALCAALTGCSGQIDENMLTTQADYSINISLPYPTVTPPPAHREQAAALVIDSSGSVIVNDSATVLDNQTSQESSDSNYKSLRQGNTGLAVQALQTRLQELGYYTAEVSGLFDTETEAAVRRFEQTYGTMQTGVATSFLQEKLFSPDAIIYASEAYNSAVVSQYSILQRGDVGSSVYALQQRLKNLGYPISELTGIFDNETANAVMLFYEAYGLTASEVANVALQKEIYSDAARTYTGSSATGASASESLIILDEENVARIQQHLIALGYLTGEADGQLDARTQIAVKLFEEACGQLPSGAISKDILTMLSAEHAPAFETLSAQYANLLEGSGGEDVTRLQTRLVELGFATGSATGDYAAATSESVKLFQTANGLEPTGVANVYTQAVLFSSFALNIDGETAISTIPAPTEEPLPEATPEPVITRLSPGSSGDAVLRLQTRLTELGYVSSVTGTYDGITSRAITTFQTILGCEPTGEASSELIAFIYSDAAPNSSQTYHETQQPYRSLRLEDTGDDVTALQKRLWELDYLKKDQIRDSVGTVNEATQAATAALQADIGYEEPDGIASAELQCYIFSDFCKIEKAE